MLTQDQVLESLKQVKYPGFSRDIVSFGLVKQITVNKDEVAVVLQLTSANADISNAIRAGVEAVVRKGVAASILTLSNGAVTPQKSALAMVEEELLKEEEEKDQAAAARAAGQVAGAVTGVVVEAAVNAATK